MIMASTIKAAIYGFSGLVLLQEEKDFFRANNPLGFILFARNCENKKQIRELTDSLREFTGRDDTLILIDQEGGRVRRLKPPHWRDVPAAGVFAKLAEKDIQKAKHAVYLNHRLMAYELSEIGVNVDCTPMLDISIAGSHDIVGDRSFGGSVEQVSELGRAACEGLLAGGILPVIKHIPGHGRAKADSHESLPEVNVSYDILSTTDFVPFINLADMPIAMTAHIKYSEIDNTESATLSKKAINIIREKIGFDGLLLTDDLSMKALTGGYALRAEKSISAGCDVILHCNGKMEEMEEIASTTPVLNGKAETRLKKALEFIKEPDSFDFEKGKAELNKLLKQG